MKIALCLSGQARGLYKAYNYVYKNLLQNNSVDVFCHSWSDYENIEKLYKPKKILIENSDKIILKKEYKSLNCKKHPPINTFSFYYSLMSCNYIREEYENENNFKYDFVIRSRYDYAISRKLNFKEYNSDKIWTPLIKIKMPPSFICTDQFAFSSSFNMSLYSTVYKNIDFYYDTGTLINGEDLLSAHIKYLKIEDKISYVDMWDPFYGGKYNFGPHSLVRDDMESWII